MNVTAVARLPHRLLTAFLLALVLWPMVSVGPAEAAVYVVKQCNPATTYEHDWLAPTDRPDAFWAEARCWEGSLNLNAWPIKSVWNGNGISWIAFAPDGTTFAHWRGRLPRPSQQLRRGVDPRTGVLGLPVRESWARPLLRTVERVKPTSLRVGGSRRACVAARGALHRMGRRRRLRLGRLRTRRRHARPGGASRRRLRAVRTEPVRRQPRSGRMAGWETAQSPSQPATTAAVSPRRNCGLAAS